MRIEMFDVYVKFRQAQSRFLNRPYRLPKDFDSFVQKKMSDSNRTKLEKLTQYFNTNWNNIDVDRYFDYGFELFGKGFSYNRFLDPRLIQFYIDKDKNLKRSNEANAEDLKKSIVFVKKWIDKNCKDSRISPITVYCNRSDEKVRLPIKHYTRGDIHKLFLTWLIREGYFRPKDYEMNYILHIADNFRTNLDNLKNFNKLMDKAREILER